MIRWERVTVLMSWMVAGGGASTNMDRDELLMSRMKDGLVQKLAYQKIFQYN
jgi:hypothetical protein